MGEQIANNRTMHGNIQLYENESGEYYPVVEWDDTPKLVRGEYHPIGNRFNYPKQWGKKYAAKVLLENKIAVQQDILYKAEVELSKLQRCLESIQQWSDSEE